MSAFTVMNILLSFPIAGGAAGAVSRITGTIGKGVAALTLDEEYKRHRREQLAHRPGNFSAGLAQGGKGLVLVSMYYMLKCPCL